MNKPGDRSIVQLREFGKDRIPAAVLRIIVGHQKQGLRGDLSLRRPRVLQRAQAEINLQRPTVGIDPRNGNQSFQHLFGSGRAPVALAENQPPHLDVSRDARFAIWQPLLAGEEDQQRRGLAERGGRRIALGAGAVKGLVKPPEPGALGKVRLLRGVDTGQGVKIQGHPSPVALNQVQNELSRRSGIRANQFSPIRLCGCAPRNQHPPRTNAELRSVEVQNRGVRQQSSQPDRPLQDKRGFRVDFGEGPIQAGHLRIMGQKIHQILAGELPRSPGVGPVRPPQQYRDLRRRVGIDEGGVGLQGLFEAGERKTGVDGDESPLRIESYERCIRVPALVTQIVTKHFQQRPRFGAMIDANLAVWAGEGLEFPRLAHIPLQQKQELGFMALLIAEGINAAGQQRKHAFGRDLLADSSHPQQRPQRSGNGDELRFRQDRVRRQRRGRSSRPRRGRTAAGTSSLR